MGSGYLLPGTGFGLLAAPGWPWAGLGVLGQVSLAWPRAFPVTESCQSLPEFPGRTCSETSTGRSRVATFTVPPPGKVPNTFWFSRYLRGLDS